MNPSERLARARAAAGNGDYESALEDYAWCFDHGIEVSRSFIGVRNSYVLFEWAKLATLHPPAEAALRARRSALAEAVFSDSGAHDAFTDLFAIDHALGELAATHEVFVRLRERSPEVAEGVTWSALHVVRAVRDHALHLELVGDFETYVRDSLDKLERSLDIRARVLERRPSDQEEWSGMRQLRIERFAEELGDLLDAIEFVRGAEAAAEARALAIGAIELREVGEELLPLLEAE